MLATRISELDAFLQIADIPTHLRSELLYGFAVLYCRTVRYSGMSYFRAWIKFQVGAP